MVGYLLAVLYITGHNGVAAWLKSSMVGFPCATHFSLGGDLYPVEPVGQRIDDNENITELSGDDASPVVPCVLRPYYVHLVIAKVTSLGRKGRKRWKLLLSLPSLSSFFFVSSYLLH